MSKYRKSKKKKEEELINLVEARDSAQSWIEKNQILFLGILAGLVLLVAAYFVYNRFIKAPAEQEAAAQLSQAQYQFERDSFTLALTNPGNGFAGFIDIIDDYGSTKSGNLANYYAGVSYLHLGQFEVAVDYLEDFKPSGIFGPVLKYGTLGDAYSELQDFNKAIANYAKAANQNEEDDLMSPYYLFKLGLLKESQGDKDGAGTAFKKIRDSYPDSEYGKDINKYIVRVE